MIKTNYFKRFTILLLFLLLGANASVAQDVNYPAPRTEKLLNGLKLLVWNVPNNDKVTVKLRVHSGSIFDRTDKEGTMALLGEILFPNDASKEYFEQDLNGSLEIESNYDYIQINATGDSKEFLTILQTIATAVSNPDITKETTAAVAARQKAKLKELEKDPKYPADRAVAERIFTNFPYGKSQIGTEESLSKIDFADLIFARQRFLTPNNATLAIVGNVKPDFAYRATRRYFGSWIKSDEKTPASFRQPSAPDTDFAVLASPIPESSELRFALRDSARTDRDYYPSVILAKILQNRLEMRGMKNVSVENSATLLPGFLIVKFSDWNFGKIQKTGGQISLPPDTKNLVADSLKKTVTADEFDKAKKLEFAKDLDEFADLWLDVDTYKLASVKDELQNARKVTLGEVQAVAEIWRKQPIAGVLLVNTQKSDEIPEAPAVKNNE